MSEFQFKYVHRGGMVHRDADALIRNPVEEAPPENVDPASFPVFDVFVVMSVERVDTRSL